VPNLFSPAAIAALDAAGLDLRAPVAFEGRPACLVGNSRAVWAPFVSWLRAEPRRAELADPFDTFASTALARACTLLGGDFPPPDRIVFPYERGAPDFVGLAVRAGLLWKGAGGLGVHPVFGPWVSLRALFVFPAMTASFAPGEPTANACAPCEHCETGCGPAYRALSVPGSEAEFRHGDIWRGWARARAACPTGAEHRYDADQLEYHYTHDRQILRRLARTPAAAPPEMP
jgi:hypothetical protein